VKSNPKHSPAVKKGVVPKKVIVKKDVNSQEMAVVMVGGKQYKGSIILVSIVILISPSLKNQ